MIYAAKIEEAVYNSRLAVEVYYVRLNDFLTLNGFCEYYQIDKNIAEAAIALGKKTINNH